MFTRASHISHVQVICKAVDRCFVFFSLLLFSFCAKQCIQRMQRLKGESSPFGIYILFRLLVNKHMNMLHNSVIHELTAWNVINTFEKYVTDGICQDDWVHTLIHVTHCMRTTIVNMLLFSFIGIVKYVYL